VIVIVCGSRTYSNRKAVRYTLESLYRFAGGDLTIRHGAASGADTLAEEWAADRGVLTEPFPADWTTGRGAGPRRNRAMLEAMPRPALVVAFPSTGPGTANMVAQARSHGVRVIFGPCDVALVVSASCPQGG